MFSVIRKRLVTPMVASVYFGALVGLTFVEVPESMEETGWVWSFVLFIPVGVLLVLLMGGRRWWAALGFGMLGAAWIEAAQTVWLPECAHIADLVAGCAGVASGIVLTIVVVETKKSMRSHVAHRIMSQSGNRELPQD